MSVHYKFKSAREFDTVTFDGLHISVRDLKKAILHQKRIGKNTDFDLQVTNAQTKEVYTEDGALIPKNTSLIVARIPLTAQQKKAWDRAESNQQLAGLPKGGDSAVDGQDPSAHRLAKAVDLSSLDASEEDKIQAMMTQSTQDYNPVKSTCCFGLPEDGGGMYLEMSATLPTAHGATTQEWNQHRSYMKIRGAGQMGEVPTSYRCFKCHQPGHWIKNCPLGLNQEPIEIKKSTGIPRSFMVPVEGPGVPGAMMTPTGQFAVPAIDHQAYKEGKKERPPFQQEPEPVVEKPEIPEDLLCSVCKDLLTDAVMIPCCGNSFCDECIRTVLLESEDHECPDCKEKDVSPDTLIPNRFLRNNVNNFKNETGYNKRSMRQPQCLSHPTHGQPVQVIGAPPPMQQILSESSGTLCEFTETSAGDMQGVKVEVITSTGIAVHPPRLHHPVPSTIPVLGSSHVERGPVIRQPVQTQPQSVPPAAVPSSSGSHGPPVQHGGPPLLLPDAGHVAAPVHIQDPQRGPPVRPQGHPHLQLVPQPPGVSGPPVVMQGSGAPPGAPGVPLSLGVMPPGHDIAPLQPPAAQQPQHMPGIHPVQPSGPRRSVEERPGTPTIDEHNQDVQSAPLPDTSVPPPNFPPGEEPPFTATAVPAAIPQPSQPAAQPIETLGARFQHRMPIPHSYRGEHPYGPVRNFAPRGSHFEHGHLSYHHDTGPPLGPRPTHYADLDRDGHLVRGSFRGYHRGRGRIMHGGYRGTHIHHQPLPPGLSRGSIHNGNQAGTIDDPLEAFERMLREKDERDHKLRRSRRSRSPFSYSPRSRSRSSSSRSYTRSRSRSRTRSRSRSRTRTPRSRTPRSRTPRKRSRTRTRTRSRSRSFTISRSRSRSFSRSPTPRPHSPRSGRDYSPRRRVSPRYRTPPRSPPSRYQRPYKEVRPEFEPAPFYEPPEFQYTGRGGGRGRGGRFGQRKDYGAGGGGGKDYYEESYSGSRYAMPHQGGRDMHHRPLEPLLPHPPGVPPQSFRRYDHFDVAPPGTGPDIPGIGSSYEKPRYERSNYENRSMPAEDFLTPPGVDHRYRDRDRDVPGSRDRDIGPPGVRDRDIGPPGIRDRDVGIRDRDMGMPSMRDRDRDIGPPGVRDRDLGFPLWDSKDRGSRDDLPSGRDRDTSLSERSRDKDRDRDRDIRERDGDRDRDRGRGDYYESDHRRSYDKGYGTYSSPDAKKRKQSLSPGQGRHDRYSSSERHHRRGGERRKNSGTAQMSQGGKENRHVSQQQPVETVVDAAGGQRDRDKDTQKRERVLVEVRKEPSVDRLKKDDKGKKEEDGKKGKDKKKKKKEKEPEGEKLKKKRRKEKKEGKKEGQETQERMKLVVKGTERKPHHKEKEGEEKAETEEDKMKAKPTITCASIQQEKKVLALTSGTIVEKVKGTTLRTFDAPPTESIVDGLYGDMEDTRIDDNVIANYGKVIVDEAQERKVESDTGDKGGEVSQELGEGVEVRVKTEGGSDSEAAMKPVAPDTVKANVMLAPLPEPSKWELEEEFTPGSSFEKKESEDGAGGGSQTDKAAGKVVTSEVLKRAENAIFQKAINAIRPIEPPKKVSSDRKVYTSSEKRVPGDVVVPETVETRKVPEKDTREARKTVNSIQITIPTAGHVERSVEIASLESSSQQVAKGKGKLDRSKFSSSSSGQWADGTDSTSPHRVSAKERLGARVDGDGDRKKDDKESKRHHSRSESRERKHSAAKKGLKSAVEKKRTVSRSRSRSPYHRKPGDRKESKYGEETRRYEMAGDRRYALGDSRSKRGDREGRYIEMDRERRPLERGGGDCRRREHSESKKWEESREKREHIRSPERKRERSGSHENKVEKMRPKPKEEREKSVDRGKARHKAKKKTKSRRSESTSRKKSVSDRESKRGKKKDKKHKKEKGKKHKQRDEKKESESGKEKEEESEAVKEVKVGTSNDAAASAACDGNGKVVAISETADLSKDKPRKGGRRNPRLASDRKKTTLDEASFEPDYDASSSVDTDVDDGGDNEKKLDGSSDKKSESNVSPGKKRDRSASIDPAAAEQKRQKLDKESVKSEKSAADETAKKISSKASCTKAGSVKKRDRSLSSSDSSDDDSSDDDDDDSSSGSSSSSDDSSDDSSVHRRRKKKSHHRRHGKRSKKSSRRISNSSSDTDSESESASSSDSDEGRGRKGGRSSRKHQHRNKVSKKKKKSSKHR